MAAVPKTVEPVRRRELTRDAQGAVGRWRTAAGTPAAAAAAAILLAMAGLWLLSGVRPGEIARFATFEMVFVLVPGWAVYQAGWKQL